MISETARDTKTNIDWNEFCRLLEKSNDYVQNILQMRKLREMPDEMVMPVDIRKRMRERLIELLRDVNPTVRYEAAMTLDAKATLFKNAKTAAMLWKASRDSDDKIAKTAREAFKKMDMAAYERRTNLAALIESRVLRFFEIMRSVPEIKCKITDGPNDTIKKYYKEIVTIIFENGEEIQLKYDGRAHDLTEWQADSTKIQIDRFVAKKGKEPKTLRFAVEDDRDDAPPHQPILEFAYSDAKNILNDEYGRTIDLPYRLAGGTLRIITQKSL